MLTPKETRLQARLAAIEYLLTKLFAAMTHGVADEKFETLLQSYREGLEKETIPSLDPALGDLVTAEIRDEVLRLLSAAQEIRKHHKLGQ